ncbi:hypothetical protein V2J09_018851 [Rumex salicifolius]
MIKVGVSMKRWKPCDSLYRGLRVNSRKFVRQNSPFFPHLPKLAREPIPIIPKSRVEGMRVFQSLASYIKAEEN